VTTMQRLRLPLSLVAASALLVPAVAMAVPDAGSKARGDYNFFGHSAHTAFSSARGHVESYQRYLSDTPGIAMPAGGTKIVGTPVVGTPVVGTPAPVVTSAAPAAQPAAPVMQLASPAEQITAHGAVDPEIAREASDAIADDIELIQRHVTRMQARAKNLGDADAIAKLADVEKQLGVARRGHAALHDHHAGESIAPATAMELARKVNEALRTAHAEHDEVLRRLGDSAAK